jgi:thiol-disulfide isomerase/thioredoxin
MIPPDARVIVAVISMDGCPACQDYVPRVEGLAGSYRRAGVPVVYLNAADPRPDVQAWMDRYGVTATPTTLVIQRQDLGGGVWRSEGNQDERTIKNTLDFAYSLSQQQ